MPELCARREGAVGTPDCSGQRSGDDCYHCGVGGDGDADGDEGSADASAPAGVALEGAEEQDRADQYHQGGEPAASSVML